MPGDTHPGELVVKSLAGLKALSNPTRARIVFLLSEPRTVKGLAKLLRLDPVKLYYHVNLLVKHGLIVVAASSKHAGVEERTYRLAAKRIRIDDALTVGAGPALAPAHQLIAATLRDALADVARLRLLKRSPKPHAAALHRTLRLRPHDLHEIVAKFDDLLSSYDASGDPGASASVGVTLALIAKPKESS